MHRLFLLLTLFIVSSSTVHHDKSKYKFSLLDSSQHTIRPSGNISSVTIHELPILRDLSMRYVSIAPSGIREPHWHANADELGYCLNGSALVTIFGDHNEHESFLVRQGEMYYVPSGYLHHIENVNDPDSSSIAEFIVAFTNELPEDFGLSSAFNVMSNAVLGNTFGLKSEAFNGIQRRTSATVFGQTTVASVKNLNRQYEYPNKFKFNAEGLTARLSKSEGSVKTITSNVWPILHRISMYSLRINTTGMREPHWHPKTAEMGYVISGQARMTILSPGDEQQFETYTLKAGDMYFVPRGYPHQIENIGNELTHFLVFFDQSVPGDIGFTGSFSAYSRNVIAATLQCQPNELPEFPFYPEDLLIVKRINPIDQ